MRAFPAASGAPNGKPSPVKFAVMYRYLTFLCPTSQATVAFYYTEAASTRAIDDSSLLCMYLNYTLELESWCYIHITCCRQTARGYGREANRNIMLVMCWKGGAGCPHISSVPYLQTPPRWHERIRYILRLGQSRFHGRRSAKGPWMFRR